MDVEEQKRMNPPFSLFCEHCGLRQAKQATSCAFCGSQLPSFSNGEEDHALPSSPLINERYRPGPIIRQGSLETVFLAQDTNLNNRLVTIKQVVIDDLSNPQNQEVLEAWRHGATLLAQLHHAHLPEVYEHFQEDGRWYLVMSALQGETLQAYQQRKQHKKLPLHEILDIGKQLSSLLHYLHQQQPPILLQDIAAENIMRTVMGQISVLDLQPARPLAARHVQRTIYSRFDYGRPTSASGARPSPNADMYGLGALLYHLLTGRTYTHSFTGISPLRVLEPDIPAPLVRLLEHMLDEDPYRRPASMLMVEQELQRISMLALAPQPVTLPPTPSPKKRTSPFLWIAILLSICGLVAGSFIGINRGIDTRDARAMNRTQQIAAQSHVYLPKGTLALIDPLTHAGAWQPQPLTYGGQCQFMNGTYRVQIDDPNHFNNCNESALFKNFVVQVNMTILQGFCGGLVLRGNAFTMGMYIFFVCSDGAYNVMNYVPVPDGNKPITLIHGHSDVINQGSQENTLAAVANGNHFLLYANGQYVDSFVDNMFEAGTIGLVAEDDNQAAIVSYRDAIIWTLP